MPSVWDSVTAPLATPLYPARATKREAIDNIETIYDTCGDVETCSWPTR